MGLLFSYNNNLINYGFFCCNVVVRDNKSKVNLKFSTKTQNITKI